MSSVDSILLGPLVNNLSYHSNVETKMINMHNPNQISEYLNQFDDMRFDAISAPVAKDQSHITVNGIDLSLQRNLDFQQGFSNFQMSDMHYDVVSKNNFTHNNMIPNTSKRDFEINNSLDQRKLENFTGVHKYYTEKKEKLPLFEPMRDLTWVNGAPPITDKFQNRYLPSNKNNYGNLPFQNKVMVKPGLDNITQEGRYSVYRVEPRNVDLLRSEINQKITYNNIPIQSGKKGDMRSVDPTITKFKLPDFREQNFDSLIPGKYLNNAPMKNGEYTNVESQRGENQFYQPNPAINRNMGDGPDKNKIKYQEARKENYLNDPTHAVYSIVKPVMTNAKSYTNYDNQRTSTNINYTGTLANNQNGNYIQSNDFKIPLTNRDVSSTRAQILGATVDVKRAAMKLSDKAKPTIRQNLIYNEPKNVIPNDYATYSNLTDTAKTTIRQTTTHNDVTNVQGFEKKIQVYNSDDARETHRMKTNHNIVSNIQNIEKHPYLELTDNAKCTIKETTLYHTPGMNLTGYVNDSYVELTDNAKTTIRQTTLLRDYTGQANAQSNDLGYVRDMDDNAKPTIRQTTLLRDYTGQLNSNSLDLGYVRDMDDVAKTTVRQTTLLRDYTGQANAESSNLGFVRDMDDIAKPTVRQTTLLMDHTGILTGMVGENISHQAAENMSIDERREISTYNRAPNGKGDLYGPYINRENVKLNEPILFSYVPGPKIGLDHIVTPTTTNQTINCYKDFKPTIDYSGYYINNNFINTLATNPLVNDIYHQKNM